MNPARLPEHINAVANLYAAAEEEKKRELSDAEKLAEEVNNLFWEIISLCLEEEGQTPFDPKSEAGKEEIINLEVQYNGLRKRCDNLLKEKKPFIYTVNSRLNSLNDCLKKLKDGNLEEIKFSLILREDQLAQEQLDNPQLQLHQEADVKEEAAAAAEPVEGSGQQRPQPISEEEGRSSLCSDLLRAGGVCLGTFFVLSLGAVILIASRVIPNPT